MSINLWHSNNWTLTISNIPTVTKQEDLYMFERNAKSITVPEYGIEYDNYEFLGYRINLPIAPKVNDNNGILPLEIIVDSKLKNYRALLTWIKNIKERNAPSPVKRYYSDLFSLSLKDNSKNEVLVYKFINVFPISVSPLPLNMGIADETSFTANFIYERIDIDIVDPNYENDNCN